MSNLVDRTYKVTAHLQPSGFVADNPNFFEEIGNAIEVFAFRVQFQVEKHLLKDPNTAEVTISNLSENTRTQFQTRPLRVEIAAGYQGVNKLLFVGDVRPGSGSKLAGTEWETKLLLGDGSRAFAHGRVQRSYKGGTPVVNILRDAANALGLSLPKELEADTQLQAKIPTGEAIVGFASDELERLLAPYGYSYSIQNGTLQILKSGQTLKGLARVISQDTGMIEFPQVGTPDKKGKPPTITVRHLLDGDFNPGQSVSLLSETESGTYKIQRVTHTGDNFGGDWTTEMELVPR